MANPWDNDPIVGGSNGPTVTPLPLSPQAAARESRDNAAANRDDIRTGIQARGESRDIDYHTYDQSIKLRQDFGGEQAVKDYSKALPIFSQGLTSANTPQGDTSLIYAYATIMDPSSSVREGEADTVGNADTIAGRARAFAEKQLGNTGTFSPEARAGLRAEMRRKMIELARSYDQTRHRYETDARAFGLEPEQIIGPHAALPFVEQFQEIDRREGRLTDEQRRNYDAIMAANPKASPDELRQKFNAAGLPGDQMTNIDEVVAARNAGRGVAPGSAATANPVSPQDGYAQSPVSQTMSGVNKGLAGAFGMVRDIPNLMQTGMVKGANALFGSDIRTPDETYAAQGQPALGGGDWWKGQFRDAGFIREEPTTDMGRFLNRAGQSVGSALPFLGTGGLGGLGMGLASATGGGVGAATAQQMFPNNPTAEFVGETLGSFGTGLGAMGVARNRAQQAVNNAVPTVDDLKQQASNLYRAAETRGVTADPALTTQLRDDMQTTLRQGGQLGPSGKISDADTSTTKAYNLIDQYAGLPMRPAEMDTVRRVIADGRRSPDASDQRLAIQMLDQFDNWARPLAPEFDDARDISSRYLQAEDLQEARELANVNASQFTGSGLENAVRNQFRQLDRNSVKGSQWFTPEVNDAVETVSRGTTGGNIARGIGRFAPTGPVSFATGAGAGAGLGALVGGLPGAAIGGSLGLAGIGGRIAATRATLKNAEMAELIARNGGRLAQVGLLDPDIARAVALASSGQLGQYVEPQYAEQQQVQPNPQPLPRGERQKPRRRGLFSGR